MLGDVGVAVPVHSENLSALWWMLLVLVFFFRL